MGNEEDIIAKQVENFQDYDFLDFGCSQGASLRFGVNTLRGTRGIGFDIDPQKIEEANELLKNEEEFQGEHIVICQDVLKIKYTPLTAHKFRFTTCIHFLEHLPGIREAKQVMFNAIKLSSKFVYITEPNFDSDVNLFKQGFKTHYSDWTSHTNHMTSNIFFNILFDFYKIGYIEDFIIFYITPIKDSSDPIIHPLNSPKNEQLFDKDAHPAKDDKVEFKNIYKDIGIIITIKGYKKIKNVYQMIPGEKSIIYSSRKGIYEDTSENFIEEEEKKPGLLEKLNNYLNSEL